MAKTPAGAPTYNIEGEQLTMREIIARAATDTNGKRLNPSTVQARINRFNRKTWAQIREPVSESTKRAASVFAAKIAAGVAEARSRVRH